MNAIVVDDSRAMRSILKRMLSHFGFEVMEAGDGSEAISQLDESSPLDLALVDWNMPVMTGFEFLQEVRTKRGFDVMKVMMVTTESESTQVQTAMDAGANAYLTKPFTADGLKEKLVELGFVSA